jgi:hypothetical protein
MNTLPFASNTADSSKSDDGMDPPATQVLVVTITAVLPDIRPTVAVILPDPSDTPLTNPPVTDTTDAGDEAQDAEEVTSAVLESE